MSLELIFTGRQHSLALVAEEVVEENSTSDSCTNMPSLADCPGPDQPRDEEVSRMFQTLKDETTETRRKFRALEADRDHLMRRQKEFLEQAKPRVFDPGPKVSQAEIRANLGVESSSAETPENDVCEICDRFGALKPMR